ncbi:Thioredoxin-like fold [Tylopilus felleus]
MPTNPHPETPQFVMSVKPITSKDEFDTLLASGKVIFIDFWAVWCGPCKTISPVFEKLAKENAREGVEFYNVDVDALPDIAAEVGISAMPTFCAFRNKEKLGTVVGAVPQRLTEFIQTTVGPPQSV